MDFSPAERPDRYRGPPPAQTLLVYAFEVFVIHKNLQPKPRWSCHLFDL